MSSSSSSVNQSDRHAWAPCSGGWGKKGNWSGLNIAAMVFGFVLFWPIGLLVLFWICSGRSVQSLPEAIQRQWSRFRQVAGIGGAHTSSNSVFDAYQETQYDRIREIKEEIRSRADRFQAFSDEAKRKRDEEEFRRFMANNPNTE